MNNYPNIEKFQDMMQSDEESGRLLDVIFGLTGLADSNELTDVVKGAQPLGSWTGWSW